MFGSPLLKEWEEKRYRTLSYRVEGYAPYLSLLRELSHSATLSKVGKFKARPQIIFTVYFCRVLAVYLTTGISDIFSWSL